MPPVHGHQIDIHVDDEIALSGSSAEVDVFPVGGFTEDHHAVGIFCVEVVEKTLGGERVVHPVANRVTQFVLGHPPMDRQRCDQVYVIDSGFGCQV